MLGEDLSTAAVSGTRWHRLRTSIPNTQPYRDQLASEIERRTVTHLAWFEGLPPNTLEDSLQAQLRPRVEMLLRTEATTRESRYAFVRAVRIPAVCVLVGSGFAMMFVVPLDTLPASILFTAGTFLGIYLVVKLANWIYPIHPESRSCTGCWSYFAT